MKKILKVDSPNDFAQYVEAPVLFIINFKYFYSFINIFFWNWVLIAFIIY